MTNIASSGALPRAGDIYARGLDAGKDRREYQEYKQRERLRAEARAIWEKLPAEVTMLPMPSINIGPTERGQAAYYHAGRDEIVVNPAYAADRSILVHELGHVLSLKRDGASAYIRDDAKRGHGPAFDRAHDMVRAAAGLSPLKRTAAPATSVPASATAGRGKGWGPGHPNWRNHGYSDCGGQGCERHNRPPTDAERREGLYGIVTRTTPGTVTLR